MVVFNFNRMRLTLLVAALCVLHAGAAKVTKKSHKELSTTKTPKKSQPAIIAIEIIDPKQNNTKDGKSRKRTIDGSLGYGYHNFFSVQPKPPKYEVYKYSQHDIPPFKVNNLAPIIGHKNLGGQQSLANLGQNSVGHKNIEIQKSVRYDLGSTKPEFIPNKQYYQPNLNQYYQHGTTLFSTLDQNGHAGSLTSQTPTSHGVPVIYLRVYTNQLGQPGSLHANIPQNHPYSKINQIDLQGLLSKYVQNHYQQQGQHNYPQQEQQNYQQQEQQYYYPQQEQNYQASQDYDLQTHENYPSDQHTKVIFHKDKGKKTKPTVVYTNKNSAQKFKITVPDNTYSKVEIEEHTVAPSAQQHYQEQQEQDDLYYYPQQQYYQQHQLQSQVQPNVQTHVQKQVQTHSVQPQVQYQYQPQIQQQVQPQTHQTYQPQQYQYYQYQDGNQYAYQQDYDYQDQYQDYEQQQQHYEQQQPIAAHPQQQQGDEHNDHVLHKTSVQVGKDLHTKLYNYHAHGPVAEEKTTSRSVNKKRKVRVTDVGNAGLNKENN